MVVKLWWGNIPRTMYGSFIKVKQSQLSAFKVEIECFLLKFEPIVRIDVHLGIVLGSRVMKQH